MTDIDYNSEQMNQTLNNMAYNFVEKNNILNIKLEDQLILIEQINLTKINLHERYNLGRITAYQTLHMFKNYLNNKKETIK